MPFSRTAADSNPTKLQVWIDRLRFVLGVVCIIAIAVTFALSHNESTNLNNRITKIESPCLRYGPKSKPCHKAFGAAIKSITAYQLCVLLSRQPELTGVKPASCVRIANEAEHRSDTGQPGRGPQSHEGRSDGTSAPTTPHTGVGSPPHSPSSSPGASPPPSAPTQPPSPAAGASGKEPPSTSGPATVAIPQVPSIVEVHTPELPAQAHACVPGVISVNDGC